jgi:hypothetical protein
MTIADKIRLHARKRYVLSARDRGEERFPIHVGKVARDLGLIDRVPAVCSALKTKEFLKDNDLQLVESVGPKSGQSTTVVYTYEFVGMKPSPSKEEDPWLRLRGAYKDIFVELGGGEAYLRAERSNFYGREDEK